MDLPKTPPGIALNGTTHMRFMFPSLDPDSGRPVTKNPHTDRPSPTKKLPQVGLVPHSQYTLAVGLTL
eukprot:scaffold54378_cov37-Prasinocladus_malaysianus.AAC.1